MWPCAAFESEYNILIFTLSGQMDVFRFHNTYFEPDVENTVKNVVDFVTKKSRLIRKSWHL